MYIPFDNLVEDARIWIFQSDRILTDEEVVYLEEQLRSFTDKWAAHGSQLNSSFVVRNNAHIIVGVDMSETQASGCSIDALVHKVQELGNHLKVDFFDRRAVAFQTEKGVSVVKFDKLKEAIANDEITTDTFIYNNLISSKVELGKNWQVKAENSWFKRYFRSAVTT